MAEDIARRMPETGLWPEGIYQLEVTDRVLGYEQEKDDGAYYEALMQEEPGYAYGPSNTQWYQLANRTRYLRNLMEVAHDSDGHHVLRDADFVTGANIEESKIAMDYPTAELLEAIETAGSTAAALVQAIQADSVSGRFQLSWALQQLLPVSWTMGGERCAFDMFVDSLALRNTKRFHVYKAVVDDETPIGDDSIDVDDTTGLRPGEWYVLCSDNGEQAQFVQVRDVLNEHRLRIFQQSVNTITDGWLRSCNVPAKDMQAVAGTKFYYVSMPVGLGFDDDVEIRIRHDKRTSVVPQFEIMEPGTDMWQAAGTCAKETSYSYEEDVIVLPSLEMGTRFRFVYEGLEEGMKFTSVFLTGVYRNEYIDDVFRPSVTFAQTDGEHIILRGSEYLSLYGIGIAKMQVQLSDSYDFHTVLATLNNDTPEPEQAQSFDYASETAPAYVRIRYVDYEGAVSRWSAPFIIDRTA